MPTYHLGEKSRKILLKLVEEEIDTFSDTKQDLNPQQAEKYYNDLEEIREALEE